MSTVLQAQKRIFLHGAVRLALVVGVCTAVVFACPPQFAWGHAPFLILLAFWAGLEAFIAAHLFQLHRFLLALEKTEPEQVVLTIEDVRGVPVILMEGAFAPSTAKQDMYEVHQLSKDYAKVLIAGKDELSVTAFRGFDARTPCVVEVGGKPIVLVASTRKRDEASFRYAKGYYFLHQPDVAIAELSKAIEQCGDHVEARVLRANLLIQRQEYQDAIKDLTEAIANFSVDKDYCDAYAMRGCAYYSIEKFKEAADDFSEVLKRQPESHLYRAQRGFCYYHIGKISNAIDDLTAVIAAQPQDYRSRSVLANIYTGKGDPVKALSLADDASCEASALNPPDHKLLLVARGLAQGAMHRRDAAIASFSQAIALDPEDEYALRCRAAQYMQGPDGPRLAEQDLHRAEAVASARENSLAESPANDASSSDDNGAQLIKSGRTRSPGGTAHNGNGKDPLHHSFSDNTFWFLTRTSSYFSSAKSPWESAQSLGKAIWSLVAACLIAYIEMLPKSAAQPMQPMIWLGIVLLWFVLHFACTVAILKSLQSKGTLKDSLIVFCYSFALGLVLCSWIQSMGLFYAVNVGVLGCLYGIEYKHRLKGSAALLAVIAPVGIIGGVGLIALVMIGAHH
jgi:tetratricopeptide (TPR) repeat protein